MINFIERIKSYSKRKDTADMAIRAWKSANEEAYANFCKRIDAVAKGDMSVLMDMYLMMQGCVRHCKPTMGWPIYRDHRQMYHQHAFVDRHQCENRYGRTAHFSKVRATDGSF